MLNNTDIQEHMLRKRHECVEKIKAVFEQSDDSELVQRYIETFGNGGDDTLVCERSITEIFNRWNNEIGLKSRMNVVNLDDSKVFYYYLPKQDTIHIKGETFKLFNHETRRERPYTVQLENFLSEFCPQNNLKTTGIDCGSAETCKELMNLLKNANLGACFIDKTKHRVPESQNTYQVSYIRLDYQKKDGSYNITTRSSEQLLRRTEQLVNEGKNPIEIMAILNEEYA